MLNRKLFSILALAALTLLPQGVWATEDLTGDERFSLTTAVLDESNNGTTITSGGTVTGGTFEANLKTYNDANGWLFSDDTNANRKEYVAVTMSEALEVGDQIVFSVYKSHASSTFFTLYDAKKNADSGAQTGTVSVDVTGTTSTGNQTITYTVTDADGLSGLNTFYVYITYTSTLRAYNLKSIKVYKGTPDVLTATKSWDFTQYTVNSTPTTLNMVHDQILFGKGVSVISMTDYKATSSSSTSTCTLLNIPGNSGASGTNTLTTSNGKFIMFRVPAGKTTVSMDVVTNGTSGTKVWGYKIGNNDVVTASASNVKYPVNKTFDVYASEVTPVYIFVGGNSGTFYFKNLSLTIIPAPTVTLDTYGYATFASTYPLDLANMSATTAPTAYKAAVSTNTVNFTAVSEAVAANTGILLVGGANETVTIPIAASGTDISATNAFEVNTGGTTFAGTDGYTYFGMKKNQATLTFAPFNPSTVAIPANKAYLKVLTSDLTANELKFVFDDENNGEVTGVNEVRGQMSEVRGEYYNLAGQRVAQPTKGLYIVNGKKVIIK